jgi:hypothetical protein
MKLLLKLAVVGLLANAAWRIGGAYASLYQFRDAVRQAALKPDQSEAVLRERVLQIAADYGVPLEESFTITTEPRRTFLAGSYEQPMLLFPGYEYQWPFTWEVDAYVVDPQKVR